MVGVKRGPGLEIKLILCPFDFSEFSIRAYQHARSLAKHYRGKLVALHVVELFQHSYLGFAASAPLYDEAWRALRESSRRVQLQEFVNRETPKEIQSEVVVELGSAADGTLSFARAHKVDVIVMGTHGRRGYDRLVLGSVTDRVMRTAPCPVLVVRKSAHDSASPWHSPGQPHHLDRILFCADFYKNSQPPLGYALSVSAEYDAELILLHVLENAPSSEKPKAVIAAATEQLETLIPADERKTLKFRTAVRVGKPYREIIHFAQEKQADMVVLGAGGRGELDVAVFGSTTYRVIQAGPWLCTTEFDYGSGSFCQAALRRSSFRNKPNSLQKLLTVSGTVDPSSAGAASIVTSSPDLCDRATPPRPRRTSTPPRVWLA